MINLAIIKLTENPNSQSFTMTNETLHSLLKTFMALPAETEWLEFKEAKTGFDSDDLGQYFSALANEANLKDKDYG